MKAVKTITTGVVLLAAAAGVVHLCDNEIIPSLVQKSSVALGITKAPLGSYIGHNLDGYEWKDTDALKSSLSREIQERLTAVTPSAVKAFLASPRNRLLLAQWQLADNDRLSAEDSKKRQETLKKEIDKLREQVEKTEAIVAEGGSLTQRVTKQHNDTKKRLAALEKEYNMPHAITDFVDSQQKMDFMQMLGNNLDWVEQIVYSGENQYPAEMLNILYGMIKKNPELVYNQMERDIATATALEFARYGWQYDRALVRADYYTRHWKAGELNAVFDKLPFWERRIVCGNKGDNDFGSLDSLEWLLEEVCLPAESYTGACWFCAYRLFNPYGESIHGSGYVEPYADIYGENRARFTHEIGGVCGSLSHFGAFAAVANGVPALTAGEPGHCAYIVRVGKKWVPAYSLSWERGLHWQPWKNVHVYSTLHMMEEYSSPEKQKETALSNAYRTLAAIFAADKKTDKAMECYEKAVETQPLNYAAWREYADLLAATKETSAPAWQQLNSKVCSLLVSRYPEVAAVLMMKHVYPGLGKAMAGTPDARLEACKLFWKSVKEMGVDRWRIEELLNTQQKMVCEGEGDEMKFRFFEMALAAMMPNKEYAPVALSWGNTLCSKMNEQERGRLMQSMIAAVGGTSAAADERAKLLIPIIKTVETSRDLTTFQSLAKMLPEEYTKPKDKIPAHQPFPGKLMSRGGMVWMSSTSQWDRVCAHWGLLEPEVGGQFHTAKDNPAWVVVQLPRQAKLTGVCVIGTTGNLHRLNGMKVQVSETGKDNDWKDVATFTKANGREFRAEIPGLPTAKYVRILRPGGPEFFHLSGIFVYGEQAA